MEQQRCADNPHLVSCLGQDDLEIKAASPGFPLRIMEALKRKFTLRNKLSTQNVKLSSGSHLELILKLERPSTQPKATPGDSKQTQQRKENGNWSADPGLPWLLSLK